MRRALVVALLLLSTTANGQGIDYWQNYQNTAGLTSPDTSNCFLFADAPFDVRCYTLIPLAHITPGSNGTWLETVAGAASWQPLPTSMTGPLSHDVTTPTAGSNVATVVGLTETSGPTDLVIGAVANGQCLFRSGSTVIGASCGGGLGGSGGGGTVTSVTANDPLFITGSPTTTPNVTIQGAIVSGSSSTTKQNIGLNASGVVEQTTTAGEAALSTFAVGSARLPFGSGSNGQITDDPALFYSAGTVEIGDTVIPGGGLVGQVDLYSAASNAYATIHSNDAGSFSGLIVYTGAGFSAAPYIQFLTGGSAYTTFGPAGSAIFDANTDGSGRLRMGNSSTGNGLDFYTQAARTNVMQIDTGAVKVNYLTASQLVATDGSKNLVSASAAHTCGANTFESSTSALGVATCTQPAFSDLSGSATCAQQPALTGAITTSAGSCATSFAGLPSSGQILVSAGATSVPTGTTVLAPLTNSGGFLGLDFDGVSIDLNGSSQLQVGAVPCSSLPAFTGAVTKSLGSCATTVNFSGLTGSASCAQLPALTGDVTTSAGTCGTTLATVGTAGTFTAQGGSITFDAKGRETAWTSGVQAPQLPIPYYFTFTAAQLFGSGGGGGYALPGTSNTITTHQVELLGPFAATSVRIMAKVLTNTLTGLANTTLVITHNGTAVSCSANSVTIPAGTTGNYDSGLGTGCTGTASGDSWGVSASQPSGIATGSLEATVSVAVY